VTVPITPAATVNAVNIIPILLKDKTVSKIFTCTPAYVAAVPTAPRERA
jgi:hypothetical protein